MCKVSRVILEGILVTSAVSAAGPSSVVVCGSASGPVSASSSLRTDRRGGDPGYTLKESATDFLLLRARLTLVLVLSTLRTSASSLPRSLAKVGRERRRRSSLSRCVPLSASRIAVSDWHYLLQPSIHHECVVWCQ